MDRVIPVKVAIRVRPFSDRERNENAQECLQYFIENNQIAVSDRFFSFDFVFDPTATQDSIFDSCATPLLEQLFKGYNCTMFAYGQTGSGKTFTMGTEETTHSMLRDSRGMIPRIVEYIFARIRQSSADNFVVKCSMLEIYEERVLDLLVGGDKDSLTIREASKGNVFVQGLSERNVSGLRTTMAELERGCQLRSKGETAMNDKSSRSHAVFTLVVHKTPLDDNDTGYQAKLHLVDLAGSERLKKTLSKGERLREGIKINEGLLSLGNVISALTESGQNRQHIPYRDSKLTRLLQDSLGGNSYTMMIACVSPADTNCEETMSSLRYAERAKKIKNKPIVNQDPNAATIQKLRQEVQSLRHELFQYKCSGSTSIVSLSSSERRELDEFKAKTTDLLNTNGRLRSNLAETVAARAQLYTQMAKTEDCRDRLANRLEIVTAFVSNETLRMENSNDEWKADQLELLGKLTDLLESDKNDSIEDYSRPIEETILPNDKEYEADDTDLDDQYPTQFVEKQTALSREMEDLLLEIKNKEKLIDKMASNHEQISKLSIKQEKDMAKLQTQIDTIQKERDALSQRVSNSTKVSEDRRRRLQDLEKELAGHRKTMLELKRMEKLKIDNEESVKKLRVEIQDLKKIRVRMVRQLREESEKYRAWKSKFQRELDRMQNRDKKREHEVEKVKATFGQQLNVYRRKYEEAVSCKKRLQQQLQRQEVTRNRKFTDRADAVGLSSEVKTFLESELGLVVEIEEARLHCASLLDQRKELSRQVVKLRRRLDRTDQEEPPTKRRTGTDGSGFDTSDETVQLVEQIRGLSNEIELRNTEIHDLQVKCTASDLDGRVDQRWAAIRTLVHAKCALKLIFEMASNDRKELMQSEQNVEEMKTLKRELYTKINHLEETIVRCNIKLLEEKQNAQEKFANVEHKYQETVAFLLNFVNQLMDGKCADPGTLEDLAKLKEGVIDFAQIQKLLTQFDSVVEKNRHLSSVLSSGNVPTTRTFAGVEQGQKESGPAKSVPTGFIDRRLERRE